MLSKSFYGHSITSYILECDNKKVSIFIAYAAINFYFIPWTFKTSPFNESSPLIAI